jgi:hypothetical protein
MRQRVNADALLTKAPTRGGAMAVTNLNSGARRQVYEALFRLNRSYHLIVSRLSDLQNLRIFPAQRLRELRGLTQEMQTETNFHLLESLKAIETSDRYRFGKVRIAREKRLKAPLRKSR